MKLAERMIVRRQMRKGRSVIDNLKCQMIDQSLGGQKVGCSFPFDASHLSDK